jgi:lipoprotein NlpI
MASAIAEHQAGRFAEAEALYRQVLDRQPQDVDALRLLGVVRFQRGDVPAAERLLRQALSIAPNYAKAHDNLAYVYNGAGRNDEALAAVRRAVELAPDSDAFVFNLGSLLITTKQTAEGVEALRRTIALNPRHASAHQLLGTTLLKLGDARGALQHLDAMVTMGAATSGVHAHRAIALAELDDQAALNELVNLDRLIKPAHIGAAHGFPSLQAFDEALAAHVADNITLHKDRTTVHGLDTGEILESSEPCVVALKRFIYGQIEARLRDLPEPCHPFAANAPRRWGTQSWGVKMWRQGYQVSHIHQKAWLSGVYYVQMPEVVREDQVGHEGWIEFGRGPEYMYRHGLPPLRLIRPVEGMMLSFPSYFWHRTIPFDDVSRDRICIAFDVIGTG